jgi:hypothetical protein
MPTQAKSTKDIGSLAELMQSKDQKEVEQYKKQSTSALASERIKGAESLGADQSLTTSNRIKRAGNEAQSKARNDAAMAKTPIGQFQSRMAAQKSSGTYDPFAGIPAEATANYKSPIDDMGLDVGEAYDPMASSAAPAAAPAERPRIGMGRQDEQRLAAMGPEYLAEAERVAQVGERKPMTATVNGQTFSQTPGASVDRATLGALAQRIALENLQKRGLEAEARQFGQQQTMARIPGQNAVDLAKQQGGDKIGAIKAEGEVQAPTRDANIAKSKAETQALTGKETRAQTEFDEANSPEGKQRAAADAMIAQLRESGADRTPEGQALMKILLQRGTAGRVGTDVADPFASAMTKPSPEKQLATVQEFTADPEVSRLIKSIQENKQGIINSPDRAKRQAAERKVLEAYINRYAAAKGVDPAELRAQIEGQLVGTDKPSTMGSALNLIVPESGASRAISPRAG